VPALEVPPLDVPPLDAPPVDAPPVDAPPLDVPPVDAPPVDAPPLDVPPLLLEVPPVDVPPPAPLEESLLLQPSRASAPMTAIVQPHKRSLILLDFIMESPFWRRRISLGLSPVKDLADDHQLNECRHLAKTAHKHALGPTFLG
jgi:hypothetical protein